MPWGWFADFLLRSGKLSQPSVRKLSNSVGMIGPSLGLLCLAFVGCDNQLTVVCLCLTCAFYGGLYSGYQVFMFSFILYIESYCYTYNLLHLRNFKGLQQLTEIYYQQATYGELSPNYAGTVAGIVSAIGNSMGFISPMIVAAFVDDNVSFPLW